MLEKIEIYLNISTRKNHLHDKNNKINNKLKITNKNYVQIITGFGLKMH